MKYPILFAAVLGFSLTTHAASTVSPVQVEGSFKSAPISLELIVLDSDSGTLAASTTVAQEGCSGSVAGIGKLKGNVLQFKPYKKEEGGEQCVIQVNFSPNGKSASVTETDCSYYHGASCGWEGQKVRKLR
ncbi:hypothetical protein [Chromobacterium vaccinii]|uniref:Uncharacterized protein n=1 Tax=Chromobacterium vaccinii TaxID=1108595 RepID=A0A1D9LHN6_9NEIS|nr:hypothetical protein [Chromobacterium vaccinii]AOZ50775.1 hypothetical protein BKX93_12740 [Chromobacterium vaccinii]SUX28712.1 Uncharacterised protein [Chromobacterium vaccinii]